MFCEEFSYDFLTYIANAKLIDPEGNQFDPRIREFDRSAGWFRAHPELTRLLEEYKDINENNNQFYKNMKSHCQSVPTCLIPFSRIIYINEYMYERMDVEVDIVKAIKTSIAEILAIPIDSHFSTEDQLTMEREKHKTILNKIKELEDAYEKMK